MSIQVTCDSCGRTYSVRDKYAGKRLSCKECGEMFEVRGEEEFDVPPSRPRRSSGGSRPRSAPAARTAKKKGTKRRKSGPNWPLIGIAGGGGLIVVAGLVWALMTTVVGNSHEKVMKSAIAELEDIADILAGIKDVPSAQAAVPKLEAIEDRMVKLEEQYKELDATAPITDNEERKLREKYNQPIKDANQRIRDEMKRLSSQKDAFEIIQFAMIGLQGKVHRVVNARSVKQVAEFANRVEQHHEAVRQKQEEARAARIQNPPQGGPSVVRRPRVRAFDPRTGRLNPDALGPQGIVVQMPKASNFRDIQKRLQEVAGPSQVLGSLTTSKGHSFAIDPIPDLKRFTDAIDFGKVANVDQVTRTITIEADESYVFKPGGKVAVDDPKAAEDYVVTETDVHQRAGADKTAVVRVKGVTSSSDSRFVKIRELVQEARQKADQQKVTFYNTARKAGDNDLFLIFGPLVNFDKFVAALDFGTVVKTFPEKRLVIFEPDYKKLFLPRTEVTITKNIWPGQGPHNGRWLAVADGGYFVEAALDDETLELAVWLYDKNKQPATMGSRSLRVEFDGNLGNTQLYMQAVPLPGEPEGQSSRFVGSFGDLVKEAKRENRGIRLNVFLGRKSHQVALYERLVPSPLGGEG